MNIGIRGWGLGLRALLCAAAFGMAATAYGQEGEAEIDVDALVRAGEVEKLHEMFHGGRTPTELRLLAFAQTNRAAGMTGESRQEAFKDAEARFKAWIIVTENDPEFDHIQRKTNASQARLAYSEMMLSEWAAKDLDEYELSQGRDCDKERLLDLLLKARDVLDEAARTLDPMAEELLDARRLRDEEVEERYLAAGIFNLVPRLLLDVQFNRAWANLYISMTDPENGAQRSEALRAAERDFAELAESKQEGETGARCELGLAMTLREQARHEEARRRFQHAASADVSFFTVAQARYEAALNEIKYNRFEEARTWLAPLTRLELERLTPEQQGALFYINLAALWEANSRLAEAAYLEKTAGDGPIGKNLRAKAASAREGGLLKMYDLTERGGGWPALVQQYVEAAVDLGGEVEQTSAPALLFAGRRLMGDKDYKGALERLGAASQREGVGGNLAAALLFEQGACRYRLDETRAAAELFARVECEHSGSPKASRAATFAFGLWSRLADESGRREDYLSLAGAALCLVQSFPEHEQREEAMRRLPEALQAGGEYAEASKHFGAVPRRSAYYMEARYRRALCMRLDVEARRGRMSEEELKAAGIKAAGELVKYSEEARRMGAGRKDATEWSAAALIGAAELYQSEGVDESERALSLLADFEKTYTDQSEIGRVLAARINAYRALGLYDEASKAVGTYLQTASEAQAGGTLASIARGMRNEVKRLEKSGKRDEARRTAGQSIPIFEQLEAWALADAGRAKYLSAVRFEAAHMRYVAEELEAALETTGQLLEKQPDNGSYRRLEALILTRQAEKEMSPEAFEKAEGAWGRFLNDAELRDSSPERYQEARYYYLDLLLLEGRAAEVENAIRQDRIWNKDRVKTEWDGKLDELYERAVGGK